MAIRNPGGGFFRLTPREFGIHELAFGNAQQRSYSEAKQRKHQEAWRSVNEREDASWLASSWEKELKAGRARINEGVKEINLAAFDSNQELPPSWAVNNTQTFRELAGLMLKRHSDAHEINDLKRYAAYSETGRVDPKMEGLSRRVHEFWGDRTEEQGRTDHGDLIPFDDLSDGTKGYDHSVVDSVSEELLDAIGQHNAG